MGYNGAISIHAYNYYSQKFSVINSWMERNGDHQYLKTLVSNRKAKILNRFYHYTTFDGRKGYFITSVQKTYDSFDECKCNVTHRTEVRCNYQSLSSATKSNVRGPLLLPSTSKINPVRNTQPTKHVFKLPQIELE